MSSKKVTPPQARCGSSGGHLIYMIINHTAAIIVTGGVYVTKPGKYAMVPGKSAGISVELLHSDGTPWCSLPDLPETRYGHTQTGLEACGGGSSSSPQTTCVRLSGDSWSQSTPAGGAAAQPLQLGLACRDPADGGRPAHLEEWEGHGAAG